MGLRWVALVLGLAACGRHSFEQLDGSAIDMSAADTTIDLPVRSPCDVATHAFCDDFDRVPPVQMGWDLLDATGGMLSLQGGAGTSPPNGLRVALGVAPGLVYLQKSIPAATTSVRTSIDFHVEQTDGGGDIDAFVLRWEPPPAGCSAYGYIFVFGASNGLLAMQETYADCGPGLVYTSLGSTTGFRRYEIEVEIGDGGRFRVYRDGGVILDKVAAVPARATPMVIQVGIPYRSSITGPWVLLYDNVIVDIE